MADRSTELRSRLCFRGATVLFLGLLVAFAVTLWAPSEAGAHAQLTGSSPERGAVLKSAPAQVAFEFSEPVEAAFGAVRVYDDSGARVDDRETFRPGGSNSIGIGLKPGLGRGTYVATYRVVSADSHAVGGGIVFHVGKVAAPAHSIDYYLSEQNAPKSTQLGYTLARFAGYLALCLLLGVVFFDAFIFGPVAHRLGLTAADSTFASRASTVEGSGVLLGVLSAATTIVFQVATSAGEGFFAALSADGLRDILDTRSGTWMHVRLALWLTILVVWALARGSRSRRKIEGLVVLGVLAALVPALIGHAAVTAPVWLMVELDFFHVLAMSLWVGGIAALTLVLPVAARGLALRPRRELLVGVVQRFALVALVAVLALTLTGVVQSLVHLNSLSELTSTAYGRAILVKVVLLVLTLVAAAVNRWRALPALRREEAAPDAPGGADHLLMRTLKVELVLTACIILVAAALVGYAPPTVA